jgi:hypothetical protein
MFAPLSLSEHFMHSPSEYDVMPACFARHALLYVLPSIPQTGTYSWLQKTTAPEANTAITATAATMSTAAKKTYNWFMVEK